LTPDSTKNESLTSVWLKEPDPKSIASVEKEHPMKFNAYHSQPPPLVRIDNGKIVTNEGIVKRHIKHKYTVRKIVKQQQHIDKYKQKTPAKAATKKLIEKKKKHQKREYSNGNDDDGVSKETKALSAYRKQMSYSGSDVSEVPVEKRNIHNSMERQRRIGLRNLFLELQLAIPTFDDKPRVPKVTILREATAFCRKMAADDLQRQTELNALLRKSLRLTNHLRKLKRGGH
jgi:hypothetical protein